ncbi:nucleotide pyrophosphohydrolase [Terrabacter sp. NPDC000476]|uniref:nucleotide pyrophosphohydrolase n=1 Tax=Terrabacter sp. NPDC000476 TaxID=3154258 RepID=UPI0033205498
MDVTREQQILHDFAAERSWGQFHTPKNLAMALAGEVGELLALFQWLTPEESAQIMGSNHAEDVRDEVADVLIYVLRLADVLHIDLDQAVHNKIAKNRARYTVEASAGNADKR